MTRRCALILTVWLMAIVLPALPARAVTVTGGVVGSYEFYDANQHFDDDAEVRLRQSYLVNAAGDVWAPEVASYRSGLRYDIVTESKQDPGGSSSDGVRSFDIEGRIFPYSPINLTVGARVNSIRNEHVERGGWTNDRDELGLYGRFWIDFAGLPATTVNVSHDSAAASKRESGVDTEMTDAVTDRLSVSTLLRRGTAQTQVRLQADRNDDRLMGSQSFSRAASVEYTNSPSSKWLIRAGANARGADVHKTNEDQASAQQQVYVRTRYQLGETESIQMAVTGEQLHLTKDSGTDDRQTLQLNTQYSRSLGRALQGLFSADYRLRQLDGAGTHTTPNTGTSSVKAQVGSAGATRLSWLSALVLDSVEREEGASKPGASAEGRVDYRLNPALSLGVGTNVYSCLKPGEAGLADDVNRLGLQGSLRWLGGRTGRVNLSVSANARRYPTSTGGDGYASLSAGVSLRGDLDVSGDVSYASSNTPLVDGAEVGSTFQQNATYSGLVTFRPRSDLTLSLTLSSQHNLGPTVITEYQSLGQVKAEYLFYALRFAALGKVIQNDDTRSVEAGVSVRRDF